MEFAHYYRTEETVGTGNVVFRRYSSTPLEDNSRFIQLIEGSLEEITAEDWGNITAIPSYILYGLLRWNSEIFALKKVAMPDTVATIGEQSFNISEVTNYVFSANISTIGENVCSTAGSNCVCDFSKSKKVPTIPVESDGKNDAFTSDNIVSIRVPTSLASTWKAASGWSNLASKIVSL